MSETKFTPGPWFVDFGEATKVKPYKGSYICIANQLCGLAKPRRDPNNTEATANAHLIAQAPIMYSALVQAKVITAKWCHYQGNSKELFDKYVRPIDELLAKARGETELSNERKVK